MMRSYRSCTTRWRITTLRSCGSKLPSLSVSPSRLKLGRKGNTSDWRRKLMTLEEKMNTAFSEGEERFS